MSLASWTVKIDDIKYLFQTEDKNLILEIDKWREKTSIPQYVILPDGDNELMVDWKNNHSIQSLFSIIKNRKAVQFSEVLFDPDSAVVRDEEGNAYFNECIVTFYKGEKI